MVFSQNVSVGKKKKKSKGWRVAFEWAKDKISYQGNRSAVQNYFCFKNRKVQESSVLLTDSSQKAYYILKIRQS